MIASLSGRKLLLTGVTGSVARPLTLSLARDNEVWGVSRFSNREAKARLEAAGVRCVALDMMDPDFSGLPRDFEHILHFGVVRGIDRWDFAGNLKGTAEFGGLLLSHCSESASFLHCSSTSVYHQCDHLLTEDEPLADNHRSRNPTYSIAKIAAEAVIRAAARTFEVPTVIARLNVPYGDEGGMPARYMETVLAGRPVQIHPSGRGVFTPIHDDDIVASIGPLLGAAAVPAYTVNWAGSQPSSVEDWSEHFAALAGLPVRFELSETAIQRVACDTTRLQALMGPTRVDWRDGMRRMLAARRPDLGLAG
jgi:UDP-glucuronate 4-epimerase